jgi:TonB-linked SusC/RagA family outer membrane protein
MKKNKTTPLNNALMKKHLQNIEASNFFNLFKFNNLRFLKLICFILLSIGTQQLTAQNGTVNITVLNEFGKPVAGAKVMSVKNPAKIGITNEEGNVSLALEPSGLVKVSYHTYEKVVSVSNANLKIKLNNSDAKINVGYGITKTKDATTSAIDLVYSDKLQKSSLNNPTESLYGKLKGLMVLQNGGPAWNRDASMYIRGLATSGNNRILVLVDGYERDLSSLSLMDIENVSVLKDGTDLAKFGIRGANGVIAVTTKRGESNSFHVDVAYDKGFNMAFRKPNFLNAFDYANAVNQANANDGTSATYSALDLNNFKNGDSPFTHPNVDWWDATLKDFGETTNFNTSFYGGGKSINYFTSLNYQNERGFLDNTTLDDRYDSSVRYDRLNFRTNLDIQLTNTTKFIVDASGYIGGHKQPGGNITSVISAIYNTPSAVMPIRTPTGEWGGTQIFANNPVALASSRGIATLNYRTLYTNGRIVQDLGKIIKGLSAEAAVAYDNYASIFENKTRSFLRETVPFKRDEFGAIIIGPILNPDGTVKELPIQQFGTNTDISYADGFGDQVRQATGIGKINYENNWDQNKLFASFVYQEDKRVNDNQYNTFARQLFMTSASYSYKDKYFVDGVVSYAGTSVLDKGNRFGFFPAVSAAWIVNRENFLKDFKALNTLKLRGSWGMSGNDLIPQNLGIQAFDGGGTYSFTANNNSVNGIREGRLPATGLTYENSEKINLGLSLELFKQLTFSFDAFQDKRTNIVISTGGSVPSLIGVGAPFENAGEVTNKGLEGSFQWKNQMDRLKYFVSGNFTYAKNEIININEEIRPFDYLRETGQSLGQRFGLESLGFFKDQADIDASPKQLFSQVKPGDVKYKDQNNDGVINAFDEKAIGYSGSNPELNYALNIGVEYAGFGIDVLVQGIANKTLYLNTASVFWPLVGQRNISDNSAGAWTPDTAATATLPRLTMLNNDNNYRPNDIWLQSGDYLKIRHCEVYYNLPAGLNKSLKINNAKLYARGMNIFSFDNLKNVDPESTGIEYPTLASYHLGMKIEF